MKGIKMISLGQSLAIDIQAVNYLRVNLLTANITVSINCKVKRPPVEFFDKEVSGKGGFLGILEFTLPSRNAP